ncbi:MAG TPA: antitoxin [Acidimicrobiales bacterium]|nr:antitoxin [Acidimicrobiales bacterium]
MGLFDKAKDLAQDNADKLDGVIDKAADVVDEKTGGKYSYKIDKAADAARNALDDQPGDEPPRRTVP